MSVRVTERLVGDVVIASGLPKSPMMVVQSVNIETKMVSTIWFSNNQECEQGLFPGNALERVELPQDVKEKKVNGRGKKNGK